ncbi:MAG: hypothetical protein R3B70_02440 [Polyangiaceae bacterium]
MFSTLDRKVLFALVLPFASLACSSGADGTGGDGGAGGTGGTGGATTTSVTEGGGGSGGKPEKCDGPGYGGDEKDVTVGTLKANIIDQNGMPAVQTAAQVCGTDICLAEVTNNAGSVTVVANQSLKKPAFKYGDGYVYAKVAILLDGGDATFTDLITAKLPIVDFSDPFASGESVTSGDVTIEIPPEGEAIIDELLYPETADQVFRTAVLPLSTNDPGVDASLDFKAFYGAAPLETVFCPPAKVRVANKAGLEAGAAVEFWIQGLDALQHWAPYGEWVKISDGAVSDDGTEIVTADGQGFPVLSTFAIRLK